MDKITIERETLEQFRDDVLHQRGPLAENGMTSDQINDVLGLFDDAFTAALAAQPAEPVEPVAWLRFQEHADRPTTVHLCDSDHPRAFQVYAAQPADYAIGYADGFRDACKPARMIYI